MGLLSKSADKNNDFILIGKILGPHGLRGALKVKSLSDFPERFLNLEKAYLSLSEKPDNPRLVHVEETQAFKGDQWLLWFEEIPDRTAAELLGKPFLCLPRSEAIVTLPEDTFYASDLVGFAVFSLQGDELGKVSQVIQGQQDLLELTTPAGTTHLIPFVKALVPEMDVSARRLSVDVIDGLLEL
jgi:16S rRNA processing protein RimM